MSAPVSTTQPGSWRRAGLAAGLTAFGLSFVGMTLLAQYILAQVQGGRPDHASIDITHFDPGAMLVVTVMGICVAVPIALLFAVAMRRFERRSRRPLMFWLCLGILAVVPAAIFGLALVGEDALLSLVLGLILAASGMLGGAVARYFRYGALA